MDDLVVINPLLTEAVSVFGVALPQIVDEHRVDCDGLGVLDLVDLELRVVIRPSMSSSEPKV